jgi:hypothetical protein
MPRYCPLAADLFSAGLSPCRSPDRRVPGPPFRPLAGVLLTHDEITVALKAAEMLVRSRLMIVVPGPGRVFTLLPGSSPPARSAPAAAGNGI